MLPCPFVKAWYALHTKPNSEIRVARTLRTRGIDAFLPLLPGTRDGPARPLFPTYLFVECDLATIGADHLKWIPGLRRILSFDGRPAVVPESAIAMINDGLAQIEAAGGLPSHPFRPGDEVVIDSGPLVGLRGIFQGPTGPAERVHILLRFLGQVNRTEVSVEVLRPAPEAGAARSARRGTRGRGRRINYREST
jgi:transcriptional antiterminator RfaH